MATAESVKTQLSALLNQANGTTGKTDETLTAAIASLAAGFGQGGGASGIYTAKITPSENINFLRVEHGLNTTDILFALCWAETLGDIVPTFNGTLGKFWTKTDIKNNKGGDGTSACLVWSTSAECAQITYPTSTTYWDSVIDENIFEFKRGNSSVAQYIAGVTYTVIIMAGQAPSC